MAMVDGWSMVHSNQPWAISHGGSLVFGDSHLCLFLDDAAVEDMDAAVGVPRVARVVCHHADRGAGAMQLAEQVHDRFAAARIEVSGRLVREQNQRLAGHRARDSDAL